MAVSLSTVAAAIESTHRTAGTLHKWSWCSPGKGLLDLKKQVTAAIAEPSLASAVVVAAAVVVHAERVAASIV